MKTVEKYNNLDLKTIVSRVLIILSTLLLFAFNINQVSAEEREEAIPDDFQEEIIDFHIPLKDSSNEVVDEDLTDEDLTDEDLTDEDLTDEDLTDEDLTDEDLTDEDLTDEDATDEDLTDEDLTDEDATDEDLTDEDAIGEDLTDKDISEEELHNKDIEALSALSQVLYQAPSKDIEINRIDGANRFSNAVELSKSGWESSSIVYLVNGHKFADMLSGAPLAALKDAPILFTREDNIPDSTMQEINRLNAQEVVVLGGEPSVYNGVLNTLEQKGLKVSRIGGKDRYHQAELVSHEVMKGMSHENKKREAFLVSGELFSDGMSIAPVAASKKLPIFLTRGNKLDQTVIDNIPYVSKWILIGGYPTISLEVEQQMNELGAITQRIDGKDRYEVNRNILDYYGVQGDHLYVTSGDHYSDGIPASVLAAKKGNGILLLNDNNKSTNKEQRKFSHDKKGIKKYTFVGSTATLSAATANDFAKPAYTVYLDPGHGGWDSGAVNNGITEKDLNLSVSLKVNNLLQNLGYEVIMSRTNDEYIDLYDRADEANSSSADIFVSIHHNAMPNNNSVAGIETYYYQYQESDTYKPRNRGSATYEKAISQERAAKSIDLANNIHGNLVTSTGANNRGTRDMGFAVIRETTIPAVLLELGYMTNSAELNKLNTNSYQNTLANAIVNGIERYFD
jgi:N-acetylmuramoyl-L-alanine amidase